MSDFIDMRPESYKAWLKIIEKLQVAHAHLTEDGRRRLEQVVSTLAAETETEPEIYYPPASWWCHGICSAAVIDEAIARVGRKHVRIDHQTAVMWVFEQSSVSQIRHRQPASPPAPLSVEDLWELKYAFDAWMGRAMAAVDQELKINPETK